MTSTERLQRARRVMAIAATVRALVLALVGLLLTVALLLAADALIGLPVTWRTVLAAAPWLTAALVLGAQVTGPIRAVTTARAEDVALWFERRIPALRYALVTQSGLGTAGLPELEREVAAAPLEDELRRGARAALERPLTALIVLTVLVVAMPQGAMSRVLAPAAGDALDRPGAAARAARDPLATIVVRVTPPGYSGLPAVAFDDPAAVAALQGSRITVEGLGSGVIAVAGTDTTRATSRGSQDWSVALTLAPSPIALRLVARSSERVLLLDPVADSVPVVHLLVPVRDTVMRVARGRVTLAAESYDDLGLAESTFEFIVSAGAGESFTFRSGTVGTRRFERGVRNARVEAELALDTLALGPGDLIHLRAVAQDRNDVSGPGRGVSETRTIRIARADEYDSVSVEPAPPPGLDTAALSQRMILIMTEELHAHVPRISRAELTRGSRRIAVDQTKLRKRVGELIFQRLGEDDGSEHSHFAGDGHEHGDEGPLNAEQILAAAERAANVDPTRNLDNEGDETPVVAINRPLLEAYNHMWRASTALETADPGAAIPWMKRAIEALQRARAAERIYLRGRPPRVVVDIARVRGTGKDDSAPAVRAPRPPLDPAHAARLARFDVALGLVLREPTAAADSLLLIRITLTPEERATALALDAAATALRRGGDVTAPLALARRALAGEPSRVTPISAWGR